MFIGLTKIVICILNLMFRSISNIRVFQFKRKYNYITKKKKKGQTKNDKMKMIRIRKV